MGTIRYFSGSRDQGGKRSALHDITRLEIQKNAKFTAAERYKRILKKKFEESKYAALTLNNIEKKTPHTFGEARKLSKKAEQALKQVAAKKAAKQAKAERRMVIIQPRIFSNGRLVKNGKIYDIAGTVIGSVNAKNGRMSTIQGMSLGKYKPKSHFTHVNIQEAINRYSPYYINLRKMQAMQQNGLDGFAGQEVINVHGSNNVSAASFYGESAVGPRSNVGVTAWGARSDNPWGVFTDNAWGTMADNAWGTASTDVWGGIGGSPFGSGRSVQIWGTGNGRNYLRGITNFFAGLLGLKNKKTVNAFRQHRAARAPGGNTGRTATPMRR